MKRNTKDSGKFGWRRERQIREKRPKSENFWEVIRRSGELPLTKGPHGNFKKFPRGQKKDGWGGKGGTTLGNHRFHETPSKHQNPLMEWEGEKTRQGEFQMSPGGGLPQGGSLNKDEVSPELIEAGSSRKKVRRLTKPEGEEIGGEGKRPIK